MPCFPLGYFPFPPNSTIFLKSDKCELFWTHLNNFPILSKVQEVHKISNLQDLWWASTFQYGEWRRSSPRGSSSTGAPSSSSASCSGSTAPPPSSSSPTLSASLRCSTCSSLLWICLYCSTYFKILRISPNNLSSKLLFRELALLQPGLPTFPSWWPGSRTARPPSRSPRPKSLIS